MPSGRIMLIPSNSTTWHVILAKLNTLKNTTSLFCDILILCLGVQPVCIFEQIHFHVVKNHSYPRFQKKNNVKNSQDQHFPKHPEKEERIEEVCEEAQGKF